MFFKGIVFLLAVSGPECQCKFVRQKHIPSHFLGDKYPKDLWVSLTN